MAPDNAFIWLAIVAMGLVTLASRVGGVYLGRFIPTTPFWKRFFDHLPSTLLLAIAAPSILSGELAQVAGAIVTIVVAIMRAHLIVAMAAGITTVALIRAWL